MNRLGRLSDVAFVLAVLLVVLAVVLSSTWIGVLAVLLLAAAVVLTVVKRRTARAVR